MAIYICRKESLYAYKYLFKAEESYIIKVFKLEREEIDLPEIFL